MLPVLFCSLMLFNVVFSATTIEVPMATTRGPPETAEITRRHQTTTTPMMMTSSTFDWSSSTGPFFTMTSTPTYQQSCKCPIMARPPDKCRYSITYDRSNCPVKWDLICDDCAKKCPLNEIFHKCGFGVSCPETCSFGHLACKAPCKAGCACIDGYVRDENSDGKCIPRSDCPVTTTTTASGVGLNQNRDCDTTDEVKNYIVKLHNDARRKVGAANMKKIKWSEEFALKAKEMAKCVYDQDVGGGSSDYIYRGKSMHCGMAGYRLVGKNPYVSCNHTSFCPKSQDCTITSCETQDQKNAFEVAFMKWAKEETKGRIWRQVTRANTEEIGCAMAVCDKDFFWYPKTCGTYRKLKADHVFCYYGHRESESDQNELDPMHAAGSPCSQCVPRYGSCENKLCVEDPNYEPPPCSDNIPDTWKFDYCGRQKETKDPKSLISNCDLCSNEYFKVKPLCSKTCGLC